MVHVEVVVSLLRGSVSSVHLDMAVGSTLAQALQQSGLLPPGWQGQHLTVGIWGRCLPLETVLRERDRVEVYRALTVDPKEARRQRFKATPKRIGTRTARSGT